MLMEEPTVEMFEEWKKTWNEYKNKLKPNKKSATEVVEYLKQKYIVVESVESELKQIVIDNITMNTYFSEKIPKGKSLKTQVFYIENINNGKILYDNQDEIFKGNKITVGIEFATSFFMVEGSSYLHDELIAFQGLDEKDLTNYFLVAEYISSFKKIY